MAVDVEIDVALLKSEIKKTYASVSDEPKREFIFPTGRAWAEDLGYLDELATVPEAAAESFAGVANQFSLGPLVPGERVLDLGSGAGHHPFHIHGAGRFLILARDGAVEPDLVWKDTVFVPTGQVVDLLLEVTNAGRWMAHCHIVEHHESGMMMVFDVEP